MAVRPLTRTRGAGRGGSELSRPILVLATRKNKLKKKKGKLSMCERTIKRSLQGSAATRCVMGRVSRRSRRRLEGIGSVFFVDVHDGQAGELDDMHPHRVTRLTQCKER